jgi:hypothetical protein
LPEEAAAGLRVGFDDRDALADAIALGLGNGR